MGLALSGFGTILGGSLHHDHHWDARAGHDMFRMPIFCWKSADQCAGADGLPGPGGALLVLESDRKLGTHVFDAQYGGH